MANWFLPAVCAEQRPAGLPEGFGKAFRTRVRGLSRGLFMLLYPRLPPAQKLEKQSLNGQIGKQELNGDAFRRSLHYPRIHKDRILTHVFGLPVRNDLDR